MVKARKRRESKGPSCTGEEKSVARGSMFVVENKDGSAENAMRGLENRAKEVVKRDKEGSSKERRDGRIVICV